MVVLVCVGSGVELEAGNGVIVSMADVGIPVGKVGLGATLLQAARLQQAKSHVAHLHMDRS